MGCERPHFLNSILDFWGMKKCSVVDFFLCVPVEHLLQNCDTREKILLFDIEVMTPKPDIYCWSSDHKLYFNTITSFWQGITLWLVISSNMKKKPSPDYTVDLVFSAALPTDCSFLKQREVRAHEVCLCLCLCTSSLLPGGVAKHQCKRVVLPSRECIRIWKNSPCRDPG